MNIEQKLASPELSEQDRAYYSRILRVLGMENLTERKGHPIEMIVSAITTAPFFEGFSRVRTPEIVSEWETFDLFNFPENHVARRPSDSYFLQKSSIKKESILLRPHTSVMWYYHLVADRAIETLEQEGEIKAVSYGKVYRVDELDTSHHECFHQIDGLRIVRKDREIINQDTLKNVLAATIHAVFGEHVNFRFNADSFPYTTDSLEVEVQYDGRWIEVLGAGVVHPSVLEKLGIDPEIYSGWAFGFGIERLAMPLKKVPDIRIFWSQDPRITSQWGDFRPYRAVSNYPPVFKDVSFIVPKASFVIDKKEMEKSGELELTRDTESNFFALTGAIRDISADLIEEVKITGMFEDDTKFSADKKSITIRITFRSLERTLTNEEINVAYFQIRGKIEGELGYMLR